jgi:hypothetical protein
MTMRYLNWHPALRRVIAPAAAAAAVPVLMLITGLAPAAGAPAHGTAGSPPAGSGYLYGVSCKGTSFCMATGSHSVRGNAHARLVEEWDGKKWRDVPDPLRGNLTGITCGSRAFCFASLGPRTRADWNGKTWRIFKGASPANRITCGSPKVCMSAGGEIDQWNGKRWHIDAGTNACDDFGFGVGGEPCGYSGLSCGGPSSCLAIAYACGESNCVGELVNYTMVWNGYGWGTAGTTVITLVNGPLSCSWGGFCMLTQGNTQAFIWDSAGWQDASPDLPAICNSATNCDLNGLLSCGAPQDCVVIPAGSPVSLVWAGFKWQAVPLALAGGLLPTLSALSCTSTTNCMAVGSYGKPPVPIAEHWNGTKWQITKPRTT